VIFGDAWPSWRETKTTRGLLEFYVAEGVPYVRPAIVSLLRVLQLDARTPAANRLAGAQNARGDDSAADAVPDLGSRP
jgi:hypothetical protein